MDATRLKKANPYTGNNSVKKREKKKRRSHKRRKPKSNNQKTLAEELVFRNRSEYDTRSSGFFLA